MRPGTAAEGPGAEPEWLRLPEDEYSHQFPLPRAPHAVHLNRIVCRALADVLERMPSEGELDAKPLRVSLSPRCGTHTPLELNVYAFQATQHHAERQRGTFRIQLTHVPRPAGETPPRRHRFDRAGGVEPLLVGYAPTAEVFVLWDAALHDRGAGFTYSRGVQAPRELIYNAAVRGVAVAERNLKSGGEREHVVAAARRSLPAGIEERFRLTTERIVRGTR